MFRPSDLLGVSGEYRNEVERAFRRGYELDPSSDDQSRLDRAAVAVLAWYQEQGYYNVRVENRQGGPTDQLSISEGPKFTVQSVSFDASALAPRGVGAMAAFARVLLAPYLLAIGVRPGAHYRRSRIGRVMRLLDRVVLRSGYSVIPHIVPHTESRSLSVTFMFSPFVAPHR